MGFLHPQRTTYWLWASAVKHPTALLDGGSSTFIRFLSESRPKGVQTNTPVFRHICFALGVRPPSLTVCSTALKESIPSNCPSLYHPSTPTLGTGMSLQRLGGKDKEFWRNKNMTERFSSVDNPLENRSFPDSGINKRLLWI